jgi:hypothetical protein
MDQQNSNIAAILEYFYPPKSTNRDVVCGIIADAIGVKDFKKSDVATLNGEQQVQVLELLQAAFPDTREDIINIVVEEEIKITHRATLNGLERG